MLLATSPLYIMLDGRWHSVLGIVTCYGLGGLGINFYWGEIFCAHPDSQEAHPPSCTTDIRSFTAVKLLGCDAEHPLPSSPEVANGLNL
jgi:hypothetical protein